MGERTFDVLSIDAWSDGEGGWTWNDQRKVGTITFDPSSNTRGILRAFREAGYLTERSKGAVTVEKDGADPETIEIQDRRTREPLFAVRVDWSEDDDRTRIGETLLALLDCVDREAVREKLAGIPRTSAESFVKLGWADFDARLREARAAVSTMILD